MKRSRDSEEDITFPHSDGQEVSLAPVTKIVGLDIESSDDGPPTTTTLQCSMPGHLPGLKFATYHEYEAHYHSTHTNRCLECWKNFPSSHYLDLHIAEFHDALVDVRRDKGEAVYACFIEACADIFQTPKKRELHLVKSHMFPTNYFFAVIKFGIDQRRSLLRNPKGEKHRQRPRSSEPRSLDDTDNPTIAEDATSRQAAKDAEISESQDTTASQEAAVDTDMEDLATAMSSMKFVPRTIRFGPKQRAGFARR